MPRQAKWVAAGIYQPTYQRRHAYGRRRYSRELVEDYGHGVGVIHARQIARYAQGAAMPAYLDHLAGVPVVFVPMPRGGYRVLLVCPRCQKRATRLYGRYHAGFRCFVHACRQCWGLRYASQYAGRRIEAHPDYLQAAMRRQIDHTPSEPRGYLPVPARRRMARTRHAIRMRRYERAQTLLDARTYAHLERREIATDLALIILTARSITEHNRHWRKIVNQLLWPGHKPHLPTLRQLIADDDTPTWAHTVLKQALERAEKGVKTPQNTREVVKKAAETDTKGRYSAIIEQGQLDALRTRYVALGQGRRARRAA